MTAPADAQVARKSECNVCPENVLRCAHLLDGTVLVLSGTTPKQLLHLKCDPRPMDPYSVGVYVSLYVCECGADRAEGLPGVWASTFDDEAEALAAFLAAEEELIRGAE